MAAIAIPAYQDYIIRTKMAEALAAIAACKTSVAEYASTRNKMPATEVEAGCSTMATQYVASLEVTDGVITATSHNTGAKPECVLTLTPTASKDGGGIGTWTGSYSACVAKYVPSSFR